MCSKCYTEKVIEDFPTSGNQCKRCKADTMKQYRNSLSDEQKAAVRLYRKNRRANFTQEDRDAIALQQKISRAGYSDERKAAVAAQKKQYRDNKKQGDQS